MNKKILITTSSFGNTDLLSDYEIVRNPYGRKLSEMEVTKLVEENKPCGMIAGVEPLTNNVLAKAEGLKVISRCGVGLDSVDTESAKKLGIQVFVTPQAPVEAVAELVVGLIIGKLRNIPSNDQLVKQNGWKTQRGNLLNKKTIGIIGCGRIGTRVAQLLEPFDVKFLGYDPVIKKHMFCEMTSLENVLKESDVVTIHVPLLESTKGMINQEAFSLMKKTAILINAARGPIVDEDALYEALENGTIAGAALDAYCNEPYSGPLLALGNKVVLSPHQGSNTEESRAVMEKEAIDNLLKGLKNV